MSSLSRRIPARTLTVEFLWMHPKFMLMSDDYREVRRHNNLKLMDSCFWCKHKFLNGEQMALAGRARQTNVLLCQDCAALATFDGDNP